MRFYSWAAMRHLRKYWVVDAGSQRSCSGAGRLADQAQRYHPSLEPPVGVSGAKAAASTTGKLHERASRQPFQPSGVAADAITDHLQRFRPSTLDLLTGPANLAARAAAKRPCALVGRFVCQGRGLRCSPSSYLHSHVFADSYAGNLEKA